MVIETRLLYSANMSPSIQQPLPKLYTELASWFHLLTAPSEYVEEAEFVRRTLFALDPQPRTMLELGCGGGNNASHLKSHFKMTLTDVTDGMLDVSRGLNPECEHVPGDMRTVRLGRTFDAVFIHDAIMYITTLDDLHLVAETAFAHLKPGGAVFVQPDHTRETYESKSEHGGHDGEDGRGLRYVSWTHDPDPNDTTYLVEMAYLLKEDDGSISHVYDRHTFGLFGRNDWIETMSERGFEVRLVRDDPFDRDSFLGIRPEK